MGIGLIDCAGKEAAMEGHVEVLFEYRESKRQLKISPSSICEILAQELSRFGKEGTVVQLSKPQ